MLSEAEAMLVRAVSLACGLFGERAEGEREVHQPSCGSGIFIAPSLVLTATHVLSECFQLTGQPVPPRPGPFTTRHGVRLFQADNAFWNASNYWCSGWTDMSIVRVQPEGSQAHEGRSAPDWFFPWSIMPPPKGATVRLIGFPATKAEYIGDRLSVRPTLVPLETEVTRVFKMRRTKGMYDYPCFEIRGSVGGGFSGGAVFWDGKLCGIVSGSSSFEETTIVSSLWPLTLLRIGEEPPQPLAVLLNGGAIKSDDWFHARRFIASREGSDAMWSAYLADSRCDCECRVTPRDYSPPLGELDDVASSPASDLPQRSPNS